MDKLIIESMTSWFSEGMDYDNFSEQMLKLQNEAARCKYIEDEKSKKLCLKQYKKRIKSLWKRYRK